MTYQYDHTNNSLTENTWKKINKGLPSVELGRIGLDISDANPEIIYAIVEASQRKGKV